MSCDPIAGRAALQEVLGGPVTLRPVKGGGVEAVVPLPAMAKLLNGDTTMCSGSGGRILEYPQEEGAAPGGPNS